MQVCVYSICIFRYFLKVSSPTLVNREQNLLSLPSMWLKPVAGRRRWSCRKACGGWRSAGYWHPHPHPLGGTSFCNQERTCLPPVCSDRDGCSCSVGIPNSLCCCHRWHLQEIKANTWCECRNFWCLKYVYGKQIFRICSTLSLGVLHEDRICSVRIKVSKTSPICQSLPTAGGTDHKGVAH